MTGASFAYINPSKHVLSGWGEAQLGIDHQEQGPVLVPQALADVRPRGVMVHRIPGCQVGRVVGRPAADLALGDHQALLYSGQVRGRVLPGRPHGQLVDLDTDIPPPAVARQVTHEAVEQDAASSYLPFQGHRALREAAAGHVSAISGAEYDPATECVSVAGGLNGILNVLLATVEPGQEVVICDPVYAGLVNRIRLAGGVPRHEARDGDDAAAALVSARIESGPIGPLRAPVGVPP